MKICKEIVLFELLFFIEYNQRLYSLGGLAGNDHGFEHSICLAGVMPPVNGIEQICRYPGDTVKCLKIVP